MEAQRFPEDFDGLMAIAPVHDYTGRNTYAAAWFAQAISDCHGGSVLSAAAAEAIHKSVVQPAETPMKLNVVDPGKRDALFLGTLKQAWTKELSQIRPPANGSPKWLLALPRTAALIV